MTEPAPPEPGAGADAHTDRTGRDTREDVPVPELVLVTGYPAYTARRMVAKILAADPSARVAVLSRSRFSDQLRAYLRSLPPDHAGRAQVVIGDVCNMDLGLSGDEFRALTAELTTIHHMAGVYYTGVDRDTARRVNVEGTRGVLDIARDCPRLRRVCHWSTAAVSGKRKGVVLEDELDEGQSFHNFWEETKYEGEVLARAAQRALPLTVLRPGIIVGDSTTGEIDKFDGPYYLMVLIANNATQLRLPLPGRGTAPMHLVPIDYVIDAGYALSRDERAAGGTFHLTDPNPLSARKVCELVAERSQTAAPRGFIPGGLARTLLKAPGIERIARGPLAVLDSFDHQVFYNGRRAAPLLADAGVRCPPFDGYADAVVRYVRDAYAARKKKIDDEVFDPFD